MTRTEAAWVWGVLERRFPVRGEHLVALPLSLAETYAALAEILINSTTFGEYVLRCQIAGPAVETLGAWFAAEDEDFDLPDADAPFDIYAIPGANDGDFPPYPEAAMSTHLPARLRGLFGELHEPMFNEANLFVALDELELVEHAFRSEGIRLTRQPELFEAMQRLIHVIEGPSQG